MANELGRGAVRRVLIATAAACTTVALLATSDAQAQAPKPKPAPRQPAAPPAPPAQAAAPPQLQFVPSAWAKLCETQPKKICVTRTLLRTQVGAPAALAEFADPDGQPKILRLTLPLGMLLAYGTRILFDQAQQPYATAPFVTCLEGCITFYQVTDDMQDKLKKGQTLTIQAVNLNNQPMSFPVPLSGFAKALTGPPTDPKVYQERMKQEQEKLQKQAPAPQH